MSLHGGLRSGAGRPKSESTVAVRVPEGCLDAVRSLIASYRENGSDLVVDVVPGIAFDWHSPGELPDEESERETVVLRRGNPDDYYQWGIHSSFLHNILAVKSSTWHSKESLLANKSSIIKWAYLPIPDISPL